MLQTLMFIARLKTLYSNFVPGEWRVQVETMDHQEIGRIGFEVISDQSTGERVMHHEMRK